MSAAAMSTAGAAPPPFGVARVARLALKELRETLRDRRTIITLVLMPLLVYPVLSLAFRQFLLSSFQHSTELRFRMAAKTQHEWRTFMLLLTQGDRLLQERESSAANSPLGGGPILGADLGAREPPVNTIESFLTNDIEAAVRAQDIDLGVRLLPADDGETVESRFQLLYRPNTPISRQAASFVERRLRAINEHDLRARLAKLSDSGRLRAGWRLKPVADEEGHSFWLGALVPLVLILMTITGAVYPAIDLTAGERERGTLESLMAAPVPRLGLLLAKYIAVVTVAMLTAVVNLTAMTVTIATSGLGPDLFGEAGLSGGTIVAVLALLVLFAAFFSAVLLSITSFARSFKEAQAYLIPLMLVSLAPGFLSVMPGLELGPLLSILPLANIVLLARDVLKGDASLLWGAVAVLTTILYGGLALALAAHIFGSDAMLYGSQGNWSDLFRRPRRPRAQATIAGALTALAIVAPLFIIASGMLAQMSGMEISSQFAAASGISLLLFVFLPIGLARLQGVELRSGFQLREAKPVAFMGAVLLGCSLAPIVMELIILSRNLGLTFISHEQLLEHSKNIESMLWSWRKLPPAAVIVALAVVPAFAEELFFRGYLLSALRGRLQAWGAIGLTGVIFGLFHASLGGIIVLDRILPSAVLGLVLGWVCWCSRSILPGILLHLLNNACLVSLAYWEEEVKKLGLDAMGQTHVPLAWLEGATVVVLVGLTLVFFSRRGDSDSIELTGPSDDANTDVSSATETTIGRPA